MARAHAAHVRMLLASGSNVLVVILRWDVHDEEAPTVAASLGCQVAVVRPGDDLSTALYHEMRVRARVAGRASRCEG